MHKSTKNQSNRLPQWQAEKMRSLLEEGWSEVWEVVVARQRSVENSHQHYGNSRRNLK